MRIDVVVVASSLLLLGCPESAPTEPGSGGVADTGESPAETAVGSDAEVDANAADVGPADTRTDDAGDPDTGRTTSHPTPATRIRASTVGPVSRSPRV